MRRAWLAVVLFAFAVSAQAQTFVFHLSGDQEVPPVPSVASGGCHGQLNQPAATFTVTCVHDVFNATVMHIHRGAPGVNGPIAFDLGTPTSPVTATWTGMTAADINELLTGQLYINIHSGGRPTGEIRGQILPRTVDTVAFTASGSGTAATANCTADLDNAATGLAINCTHNLPSPSEAHVHEAPVLQNGPVVFTFPSPNSPLSATMPMTPQLVADFAATFLYLEIHSGGETEETAGPSIRGQIGAPPTGAGTGTIRITKATNPAGGTNFGFTDNVPGSAGTFTLNDGQTQTFSAVTAGTYTITENATSGYTVADIRCDDADSTGDLAARRATVNLQAGETVTCTFRNFETSPTDQLFVFHLDGAQEVPPVPTTARGGCMARFDAGASELSIVCTHNVVNTTIMHIHRGAPGVNGPIAFDLGSPVSPVVATWSGMTPADVADLLAGNFYVNVHTAGRPSGEIRGQILARTVDTVAFTMDSSQFVPPGTSPSTGSCTADLSNDASALAVSCTHNVPAPDAAHVHDAPRGLNGPIVFTFPSPASPFAANVPMTPRLVADFAAEFLYVDVHGNSGSEAGADQIRGQIGAPQTAATTGTIRIIKSTPPAGGTGFTFTDNIPGSGGFVLNDGQTQTFLAVPAGTYTVTETAAPGHSLTDLVCSGGDTTADPFNRTATIRLSGGDQVACTFRNLRSVAPTQLFVFHLDGTQEVPPVPTSARGGCFGQFNSAARELSLVCTHNVVGASQMHIHRGPRGVNGPVVFDLGSPESPVEAVWTNISPADVADLFAGNLYVNIHTSGRPTGEIRGQIVTRSVDNFTFVANAQQEVPPTTSTATGNCAADLSDAATSLFVQCTHNVVNAVGAHLHDAPAGSDGPIVFHFPGTPSFSANVPLTPRLVADFAAGFLYVNIHSVDFPEGEIRGQLIAGAAIGPAEAPTLSEWAMILLALSLAVLAWRRMS